MGQLPTVSEAKALEENVLQPYSAWCEGLEQQGLKQERRALCLYVNDLQWEIKEKQLVLQFTLPAGSYATSVLREILMY
jgi:tRNA pseudouridine13 synthase